VPAAADGVTDRPVAPARVALLRLRGPVPAGRVWDGSAANQASTSSRSQRLRAKPALAAGKPAR
jgi:hypothetical protein